MNDNEFFAVAHLVCVCLIVTLFTWVGIATYNGVRSMQLSRPTQLAP